MDADRRDEALTGSALDREIRAALAVTPSPEFVARVRMRIASEPARAARRRSWVFAAAAAMAALIAIAVVVSRPHEASPAAPGNRLPLSRAPVGSGFSRTEPGRTDKNPKSTGARSAKAFALQPRETPRSAEGFALQPTEPEILFDPAETRALRRLIAGTREGTLDLSASLQATIPVAMDLPPLSEIAIPLITIDPITPQADEEGARQ